MRDLQRWFIYLAATTVALFLAVIFLAVVFYVDSRGTRAALCTLRAGYIARADAAEAFLAGHPDGIPGIPRATFQQGIATDRGTVAALAGLRC